MHHCCPISCTYTELSINCITCLPSIVKPQRMHVFVPPLPQQAELDHLTEEEGELQRKTEECKEEEQSTREEVDQVEEQLEQVNQQLEHFRDNEIEVSVRSNHVSLYSTKSDVVHFVLFIDCNIVNGYYNTLHYQCI